MAIIFGSGEPVSRLRRGLDVKGKVNLGLDEIVVPMALVSDFTGAPYRRSPVRWYARDLQSGVAGQTTRMRLANTSGRDQLVDHIYIRCVADLAIEVGSGLGIAPGTGVQARTTEIVTVPANATGDISRPVPIELEGSNLTPSGIFDVFLVFQADANQGAHVPVEIVLPATPRPGDPAQNVTTLTLQAQQLDSFLDCTFTGLYFDQLPLDHRT